MEHQHQQAACCPAPAKKWYKEKLYWISLLTAAVLVTSFTVPVLNPVFGALTNYIKLIWWAILLGLLIGGIIDYLIPQEYIAKILASHRKHSLLWAVLLGFFMSACSHGILAIAIQLYKKGASTSSVVTFLLASPWANLTITILLFGFFGLKALVLVIGAIAIALITGSIYQVLERKGIVECKNQELPREEFSIREDARKRWAAASLSGESIIRTTKGVLKGTWDLAKMVLWWVMIGMMLASVARAFIPFHFFHNYMGASLIGLGVTLVLATMIEVCSEGSSPIAFEIFKQTGAFGNSFVFLMAGVSTDYTEIGLIWNNIGKRAAIFLPIITVPQILILGYIFNLML